MAISSEEKQRWLSVELVTTEVMAEAAPFSSLRTVARKSNHHPTHISFSSEGHGAPGPECEVWLPTMYKITILRMIHHSSSVGRLTWHDGLIPADEIWIKLGGIRGGVKGTYSTN